MLHVPGLFQCLRQCDAKAWSWKTVATTSLFCCDKELFLASLHTLPLTDPVWGVPAEPSAGKEAPASSAGQQLWHPHVQERDCELLPLDYIFQSVSLCLNLCLCLSVCLSVCLSLMNTRNMHVKATSTSPGLVWLIFLLANFGVLAVASHFACHSQRKQSMLLSVLLSVSLSILFSRHLLVVLKYVVRCSCFPALSDVNLCQWVTSMTEPTSGISFSKTVDLPFFPPSRASVFLCLKLLFLSF